MGNKIEPKKTPRASLVRKGNWNPKEYKVIFFSTEVEKENMMNYAKRRNWSSAKFYTAHKL